MKLKQFFALILALTLLTLTACTDFAGTSDAPASSNSAIGTGTISSDQNGVGIPEISDGGTTESGPEEVSTDNGINSDQPTQPSGTTGDIPTNSATASNPDTPTSNGASDTPTGNGGANSDTPSGGGNGNSDPSSGSGGSASEETPNPGTNDTPSTPITVPARYGRAWLKNQTNGAELVKAYDELVTGAESMKQSISLTASVSTSEISKVWLSYRDDYPEHFWISEQYQYTYTGKNKVSSVAPGYTMNATQKAAAQTAMEAQITAMLDGLHGGMDQYEIEKTIHDRLILHTTYTNVDFCHTAYGALVNRQSVCDGYARAFQLLCRRMGIETLIVRGKSNNPSTGTPEGHAWNVVKINGDYYHVDVTWDDAGEPTANNIHYGWFNVPTAQINRDHLIEEDGYAIPNCTATAQNYYRKNNAYLAALTVDGLVAATKKDGNAFVCKVYVENMGDLESWLAENLETLAKRYGLNGYNFTITTAGNEIQYRFE